MMTSRGKKGSVGLALACLVVGGSLATRSSRASDHADGPTVTANPASDLTDLFMFMRPEVLDAGALVEAGDEAGSAPAFAPTTHAVLIMTVTPNATASSLFDPNVQYGFDVNSFDDPSNGGLTDESGFGPAYCEVVCRFQPPDGDAGGGQPFACTANGQFAVGVTNTLSGSPSDSFRVWAGLRADPAFGDTAALSSSLAAGAPRFSDAGTNAFAGKNVLAIVADIDTSVVIGDAGTPYLGVAAFTVE